jgi:hypothetical protein
VPLHLRIPERYRISSPAPRHRIHGPVHAGPKLNKLADRPNSVHDFQVLVSRFVFMSSVRSSGFEVRGSRVPCGLGYLNLETGTVRTTDSPSGA